jgi:hypothetical protein
LLISPDTKIIISSDRYPQIVLLAEKNRARKKERPGKGLPVVLTGTGG